MSAPRDEHVVAELSRSAGVKGETVSGAGYASRLHHVEDDLYFSIIALPRAGREFGLCLPRGLQRAGDRHLRLVLPASEAGTVLAWSAYLAENRRPEIWVHQDWETAERVQIPSREDVEFDLVMNARQRTKNDDSAGALEDELRKSSQPKHLGQAGGLVHDLVEWVAAREDLDPRHSQSTRSWQYRGQKVLEIKGTRGGVLVTAGVKGEPIKVTQPLTATELEGLVAKTSEGIEQRRAGKYNKPDESWLQSFIGRAPHKVGIEARAFREVPAWRRQGGLNGQTKDAWGRGFVDLLGVDAHGIVRIVETKLPTNSDAPGLGFQAIDYLAYCSAYRGPLCRRLDVNPKTTFALRYVIGQEGRKAPHLHAAAIATMSALAPEIEYDVQGLAGWYVEPGKESRGRDVEVDGTPRKWPSAEIRDLV